LPVIPLRQILTAEANPSGGWGYYAGKSSRIEPTSWALLAVAETWDSDPAAWQTFARPHLQFLKTCQRADGLLLEYPQAPPNLSANGLAACVLAHLSGDRDDPVLSRLLEGIVSIKGVAVDTSDPRQNNQLQGWPWIPDTFSWVEPTSWCALALKKTRSRTRGAAARIEEADRLLVNRSCDGGGWNYGNASTLAQDLRPYVSTTALGLIALQDRRADPVVARSLSYLDRVRLNEPSAMALALTSVCLRLYRLPADDVEKRLADDVDRAERLGNLQSLAMALYGVSAPQHEARALRV
jgi:hypothetical protein